MGPVHAAPLCGVLAPIAVSLPEYASYQVCLSSFVILSVWGSSSSLGSFFCPIYCLQKLSSKLCALHPALVCCPDRLSVGRPRGTLPRAMELSCRCGLFWAKTY